jgi:hypothetical protein
MIDLDLLAHLDSQTGLPAVDLRSPAQRWLDDLDEEHQHSIEMQHDRFFDEYEQSKQK